MEQQTQKSLMRAEFTGISVILDFKNEDVKYEMEELLRIDPANITGELLAFSVIFNQIGILRAQQQNKVRTEKTELEILKSEKRLALREDLTKKYTVQSLEDEINVDPLVKLKTVAYNKAQAEYDVVDSIYWSLKSKDEKLTLLAKSGINPSLAEGSLPIAPTS